MDLGLTGKTVVITGGSAGVGLACAELMASEGCHVAIVARDGTRLREAATLLTARTGHEVQAIEADLSSLAGVEQMMASAERLLGRIDVLVNNAGAIRGGDFLSTPDAQWTEDWNLKLFGYVRTARAVLPLMKRQGGGCIINVIGAAARQVSPTYLAGGAANAALVNFTKGLSDVGAPDQVRVKAVSPGAVRTERWDRITAADAKAEGRSVEEVRAERLATYPLGRIVTPEDVANVVCFLASPRADMLNGLTVTVDGGWSRGVYP
ncbi:SDR family oxidoreductase [Hydrogenophaga sp. BPS33]|uniref:SDR family oxidoreductase n=1 Tax=Hydrogenophaga sp. BPS33 TaxID=2651974 RepID=UPI00131FFE65|nr:SDR family oxidoreductase [Hydrogenophaga sp. BPS33]QHE84762.1 SDR family oxidoreductase [Hydrogenophaga sp. BPS33]